MPGTNRKVLDCWGEIDPRYKIKFLVTHHYTGIVSKKLDSGPIGVVALLPETLSEFTSTAWASALSGLIPQAKTLSAAWQAMRDIITKATGGVDEESIRHTVMPKMLATQYWVGANPLRIPGLKVVFVGREDAYVEVVKPARMLQSLSLPRTWVGAEVLRTPPIVQVKIGRLLMLKNAIVTDVTIDWSNYLSSDGYPQSAEVSLSIQSREAYTIDAPDEKEGLAFVDPKKMKWD